jgi:hypothetical protein
MTGNAPGEIRINEIDDSLPVLVTLAKVLKQSRPNKARRASVVGFVHPALGVGQVLIVVKFVGGASVPDCAANTDVFIVP